MMMMSYLLLPLLLWSKMKMVAMSSCRRKGIASFLILSQLFPVRTSPYQEYIRSGNHKKGPALAPTHFPLWDYSMVLEESSNLEALELFDSAPVVVLDACDLMMLTMMMNLVKNCCISVDRFFLTVIRETRKFRIRVFFFLMNILRWIL